MKMKYKTLCTQYIDSKIKTDYLHCELTNDWSLVYLYIMYWFLRVHVWMDEQSVTVWMNSQHMCGWYISLHWYVYIVFRLPFLHVPLLFTEHVDLYSFHLHSLSVVNVFSTTPSVINKYLKKTSVKQCTQYWQYTFPSSNSMMERVSIEVIFF